MSGPDNGGHDDGGPDNDIDDDDASGTSLRGTPGAGRGCRGGAEGCEPRQLPAVVGAA